MITGRLKCFIKLFELRINLDGVEKKLEAKFHIPLACTDYEDKLIVTIEGEHADLVKVEVKMLYHRHKTSYKVKVLTIPHFANENVS